MPKRAADGTFKSQEEMRAQARLNARNRKSMNEKEKISCEYTGLSKEAVRALHRTRAFQIKWVTNR